MPRATTAKPRAARPRRTSTSASPRAASKSARKSRNSGTHAQELTSALSDIANDPVQAMVDIVSSSVAGAGGAKALRNAPKLLGQAAKFVRERPGRAALIAAFAAGAVWLSRNAPSYSSR